MVVETETDERRTAGVVKWFDPVRGFGFVLSDEGGPDILLHANVLRNFGQSSVADGARIVLDVAETPRGTQAQRVVEIAAPEPLEDAAAGPPFEDAGQSGPLVPARVKWFDKAKGFGFANVFGRGEDVFVHVEVLRRSALADLQPGEAIVLRVADGQRGQLATQVVTWEQAVQMPNGAAGVAGAGGDSEQGSGSGGR